MVKGLFPAFFPYGGFLLVTVKTIGDGNQHCFSIRYKKEAVEHGIFYSRVRGLPEIGAAHIKQVIAERCSKISSVPAMAFECDLFFLY